jgi:dolichol kinase
MLNLTNHVKQWFDGKKTIIGIIAGFIYGVAIYYGIAPNNELVWGAIAAYTGISFKVGINRLNTPTTDVIQQTVPNAVKYIPPTPAEPPEVLAG